METFLFTGTITTRQPLAYSPPNHVDPKKKSLLPRMIVPTAAGPMNTVFVSGSTIRGKLRHACADVYLEREKQREMRVDYERYLELKVGGVKGSSDEGRVDLRERKVFLEAEPVEPIVLNGVRRDATLDPILFDILDDDEVGKVLAGMNANRTRSQKTAEVKNIGCASGRDCAVPTGSAMYRME